MSSAIDPDWIVPDWPAPAGIHALCTTRAGGVSSGAYASLNLGDHVGDDPADVARNRSRLADAIGARPVFLQQVHGTQIVPLDAGSPDGLQADACSTSLAGVACTVMVADCMPVLLTDRAGSHVAAAHAGWRGLAAGVLGRAVESFGDADRGHLMVWLGPCIGPNAFEVGPEVKAEFEAQDPQAERFFTPAGPPGKWLANLSALARLQLRSMGIQEVHGNDGTDTWCTVANPSRFFSHRRDRVSGRFAALVWRR
ncbi:peptidoglycan editing factor PgeF [Variovorax sp. J22R133]|uniref:peptidoglycan editing factor PgeF n=1 Tax=Variovorax brevis TaxID=3053503 RepID=UPI002575266A|nr:peptidoglycan editing factor PgeF [Variovorax sp. J22R133]MDM0112074.1 peptidoglycan editing factor PgeF [Variovorax sp. J22R133]